MTWNIINNATEEIKSKNNDLIIDNNTIKSNLEVATASQTFQSQLPVILTHLPLSP